MNDKPETNESTAPNQAEVHDPGGKRGFRLVAVLFVAAIAVIAALVANQLQLIDLTWPPKKKEAAPAKVEAPAPTPVKPAPPPPPPAQPSATSEEVSNLLSTIEGLRSALAEMNAAQSALRDSLNKQQQMNLQVRLRWISDPDSHLPQIKLAWEEISLLTNLSGGQRAEAEAMHTLARDSEEKLHQWRERLHKWADTMEIPEQQNILPGAEHPWLGWMTGQFRLYRAPTEESRRQARLRQQLTQAASQLAMEQWPGDGDWQQLRAELLLHVKSGQQSDSGEAIDLGVPENFEAIKADINALRQTATQWLEQSS